MKTTLHFFIVWLITFIAPPNTRAPQLFNDQRSVPTGTSRPAARDSQAVPEGLAKSDWSGIRAAYEAGCHAFQPIEGGWQARNPGQQWTTKFDGRGFLAEPKEGGWQWGLELKSYGFRENQRLIAGTPAVKAEGQRLSYRWGATVHEWFVNDARGLEHGFTITERPESFDVHPPSLSLFLSVRGTLQAHVSTDALGVLFTDASGATVINYTGLKVWDADGKLLASHFAPTEGGVRLLVEERGARYPLTIDPIAQQAYLKPATVGTTQGGDHFGASVAISGDTVVIGASGENSSTTGVNSTPNESDFDSGAGSGAAYIFVRGAGVWTQQAYLKPAAVGTSQSGDGFGHSVAISENTVVVGAPGEDSSTTGVNSTPNELAGLAGAAYVFVRSGTNWTQQAYLKPTAVGGTQLDDNFGYSVGISGDTVVVGAWAEDSTTTGVNSTPNEGTDASGAAYVFARSGTNWTQQAYLKPAVVGTTQGGDHFGASVGVSGDTIVIGSPLEDSSTTGINSTPNEGPFSNFDSGAAYVFVRSGTDWTQQAYLKPTTIGSSQLWDQFGLSVAISGDTVVVGAYQEDSSTTGVNSASNESAADSGAAYVFVRSAGVWAQQAYLKPAAVGTTQVGDYFGRSVAVSGDTVVVGAIGEDSSTTGVNGTPTDSGGLNFDSGAAYVFIRSAGVWKQQAYLKPGSIGTSQVSDGFGYSVAVSGDTVVVGAAYEDSSTTGVNTNPNESAADSGTAYIFSGFGPALSDTDGDGLLDPWELSYWPTTAGHGALDDFDHDGHVELLELAFGLNPTQPNVVGLPTPINEGGYLTMTITKQPGVIYEVQSAGAFLPTLPDSFSSASTTVLINNATTLKVRDNVLIGTPPTRFIRVKVIANP